LLSWKVDLRMFQSLLIANRGEIACRVIRTARAMGIRTVAVYSDADARALHVRQADEAVHIGPSPARASYLVGERIIAAARETGAEAIHPGYGFLSENADFAQDVIDAGLIWVGPKPESIRAMGLKDAAKARMIAAGVPVTPGYLGEDQMPERLQAEADAIGYPVLIKAVAGGGGKGMRRVEAPADFLDALLSCRREAASSFGDDRVLLEKYILSPRHIEVQVFGDTHGQIVHLFERDCSLQRRHQKVIEEAPAPGMDEATREAVCGAAVRAAQAVDYVGAGTIEFIADASEGLRADRIWFMEMNTRLQVEHPVTEEITGQDLVQWQLRVAAGEPLPKRQEELSIDGWAMEARLYAEDPAKGFLPSVGTLEHLILPEPPGLAIRIETGVEVGDQVSSFYDPMIAKVIASGTDRRETIGALAANLAKTEVWPVRSNAGFLHRALTSSAFIAGDVTTAFIGEHETALLDRNDLLDELRQQAAAELIVRSVVSQPSAFSTIEDNLSEADPWSALAGFRLNLTAQPVVALGLDDEPVVPVQLRAGWLQRRPWGEPLAGGLVVFEGGEGARVRTRSEGGSAGAAADGAIVAPMPGRVIAVEVAAGDRVAEGQKLVTLEAMKMEHALVAPFDGIIAELHASAGGQVTEGTVLVRVEPAAREEQR
jgi:3-methylcrotonyl-CoA carboxylase alpha subunit